MIPPSLVVGLIEALVTAVPGLVSAVQAIINSGTMSAEQKAAALKSLSAELDSDSARVAAVKIRDV